MKKKAVNFFDYLAGESAACKRKQRERQCEIYTSLERHIAKKHSRETLPLKDIFSHKFLSSFQSALLSSHHSHNTVFFYNSNLRTLYRTAVRQGKIKEIPHLFDGLITKPVPTEKRAVETDVLATLLTIDLSDNPRLERCRDYFVLSFLLQGMPFIDLAHLQKSDVKGDHIVYYRRKTKGLVTVALLSDARKLIDKYAGEVVNSPYALPILDPLAEKPGTCYKNALRKQNRQLDDLTAYLGLDVHITTHVARHSWATVSYHNDVSTVAISQGMGHSSQDVTRAYLASLGTDQLLEVNLTVLNAVLDKAPGKSVCIGKVAETPSSMSEKEDEVMSENECEVLNEFSDDQPGVEVRKFSTPSRGYTRRGYTPKKKCPSSGK